MNNKGISVVIPNYNGEKLLPQIIPPLLPALQKTNLPFEIFVVDDCSIDNSIKLLQQNFSSIKILQNNTNSGFSITANNGFSQANFDYVFLLNSDVKVEEDYFLPLLKYFDDERTFGVMGRIIGWNDDAIQDGAKYPSFHGAKIKTTGNYILENPSTEDKLYSMYLSGANALYCRKKLKLMGGFNELFSPFYVEDYELSVRAWRLGFICYYDHFAVCRHQVSTSIKNKSSKNYINTIYYRNKLFLHYINLNGADLFLWMLQLIPETIFSIFTGKFYFLKSLKLFFKNISTAKKAKQKIIELATQTNKLYSFKEVANVILQSIKTKSIKRF